MRLLALPIIALTALSLAVGPSFAQSGTVTATVRPNPLDVEVAAPSQVTVREWSDIEVIIKNKGSTPITKTSAKIHSSSGFSVKGRSKKVGTLGPGETAKIMVLAKANHAGNYIIQVDVQGFLEGEKISSGDSALIVATGSILPSWLRFLFNR